VLTLRKQLKDPIFRKWFAMPPRVRPTAARTPEWFIYVQAEKGGPWRRKEARTYKEGYKWVAKNLKNYHDIALSNKRVCFKPPVVRDKMLGKKRYHFPDDPDPKSHWCGFCRRLTRFAYFRKHHAMPKWVDDSVRRCNICGARYETATRYT
jgi:hypothetical protein